ncbi:MAG: NAD(P)H-dependent flavin oxidoreductase [Hyphomicrobiaceae bacterium]
MKTRLTNLLAIDYPIVSAPMSGDSGGELAGAVSAGGGLGTFGAVFSDNAMDYLHDNIALARTATSRSFGVGFITPYLSDHAAQLDAVLDAGVEVVTLSFADPRPWLGKIKAAGRTAICQVHNFEFAQIAVEEGADVIAVQGCEAGGHSGDQSLMPALAHVLDSFPDTPVIAAGGIGDGRTLASVLAAGADGAWIGTGFRAVTECREISEDARAAIFAADGRETIRSRVTDIISHEALGGRPWPNEIANRTVRTPTVMRWHGREDALQAEIARDQAHFAEPPPGEMPYLFSEAAGFIHEQETAAAFMSRICAEAETHLRAAAARAH